MSFRPAGTDFALVETDDGKVDIVLDLAGPNRGNFRFDNTRAHALFTRIFRHKGAYYFDRTGQGGTNLYTIKDDRLATPSKFQSYVEDGADQVRQSGKIQSYAVKVRRVSPGRYQIDVAWALPGSDQQQRGTLTT